MADETLTTTLQDCAGDLSKELRIRNVTLLSSGILKKTNCLTLNAVLKNVSFIKYRLSGFEK